MTFGGDIAQFCPLQISFCLALHRPCPCIEERPLHLPLLSCALEGDACSPIGLGLVRRQGHQAETVFLTALGSGGGGPYLGVHSAVRYRIITQGGPERFKEVVKVKQFLFAV